MGDGDMIGYCCELMDIQDELWWSQWFAAQQRSVMLWSFCFFMSLGVAEGSESYNS